MTDQQKDILIAKMLESPASLSAYEVEMIIGDEELRDIYDASSRVDSALHPMPSIDVDAEWNRFKARISRKRFALGRVLRVAAAVAAVMLVAVSVILRVERFEYVKAEPESSAHNPGARSVSKVVKDSHNLLVAVENDLQAEAPRRSVASLKKQPETNVKVVEEANGEPIDIDEYLRVQQARIDNDLALCAAEVYEDQYNQIRPMLDAFDDDYSDLDNTIQSVIMQ